MARKRSVQPAPTCDICGIPLHYETPIENDNYQMCSLWRCTQCGTGWIIHNKTVDAWVNQFPRIKNKTRELWKAIRGEFERQQPPMTVRQVFYRMESGGHVEKSEAGYRRVQRCLLNMRRADAIPYHWIADNTRWVRKQASYSSMAEALTAWQSNYRRALWFDQPAYVEIWLEKDALAGVFYDITNEYDVPLYVTRGYSSETFLYEAAQSLKDIDKPIYIYHFGDFDPSGRDAARHIAVSLKEFGAVFTFVESAVTYQQIADFNLTTRPTKKTDSKSKKWRERIIALGYDPDAPPPSVELDAIEPSELRRMVRQCIEQHIDTYALDITRKIESEERARIIDLTRDFRTSTKTGNHAA